MKNLLNFGVSNPLTLGMGHPVADRLETLGRARPATWRSRCLALSAMSAIAIATAPLTIAAEHPESDLESHVKSRFKFASNFEGKKGQSYEIVSEDGVKKAYRILESGKREEVDLLKKSDGSYQLTYEDGQVIDLPNIDLEGLEGLKGLAALKGLEGLKGLTGLKSLEKLKALEGLDGLDALDDLDLADIEVRVFGLDGLEAGADTPDFLAKFPDDVRAKILAKDGSKTIQIVRDGEVVKWLNRKGADGQAVELDDTVISSRLGFFQVSDPLASAQRQLERTKRQLESMSDNENVSFDLKNALRDIESAQKSLEEAESRLLDETE